MVQIAGDAAGRPMSANPPDRPLGYTAYHPRWHRTHVSTYWWLHQWSYAKFVLRELSSVFVAWFVILTLLQVRALRHGPEAYAAFWRRMSHPAILALNVVSLFFVLFHTITWFNLAPRAMAVRVGEKRVPEVWIAAANYAAWLVISVVVGWFLLGG
jgi:succinate dehydrogenase subunit C